MKPGARLGPYEIIAPLGAGGMGEVYRASDSRLEREVGDTISFCRSKPLSFQHFDYSELLKKIIGRCFMKRDIIFHEPK